MGNEGCSYPSVKCKKRVTILVEGGEIELFDGEVRASLVSSTLMPLFVPVSLLEAFAKHPFRTV